MAIFLSNSTILVVNHKLCLLVTTDFTRPIDSFLFGFGVLDCSLTTANLDIPSTRF